MIKKICLLTDSLSSGGAEKVAANMSISLFNKGYDVFIVSMQDNILYPFKGELYNFGKVKLKYHKLRAFFEFKIFCKKHNFDVVIDHRVRTKYLKELIFAKFIFQKSKVFYCVHSYNLAYYFSFLDFPYIAKIPHVKNKKFISICVGIQSFLEQKLNIKSKVIYNYLPEIGEAQTSENNDKSAIKNYIIGVGRLDKIKQFDILIKSYNNSKLQENNVGLVILGNGPEKHSLSSLITDLNLNNWIKLIPFKKNPYDLVKNANALVLTSKVEGFPMVLLESLSLSTPIIAFNCKCGPSEIIKNGVNGILVEDQNEEQLVLALNRLLNETFYLKIKKNTQVGLDKFFEDTIVQQWINVLENQI